MVGDARQHVGKIRFGVKVIEFGCLCRVPDYADNEGRHVRISSVAHE